MSSVDEKRKLLQPLTNVPGVGSTTARLLSRLGLETAADLLFYFPRRYEDFSEVTPIAHLEDNKLAQVIGYVKEVEQHVAESGRHVLYLLVEDQRRYLRIVFFNQAFLLEKFKVGQMVMFRGTVRERGARKQMTQPRFQILDPQQPRPAGRLLPVYGLTEGLKQRQLRQIIERQLDILVPLVEEALPALVRQELGLCDIETALRSIHFPKTQEDAESARRRLAFQELFILQLALATRRHRLQQLQTAPPIEMTPKIRDRIYGRFPFELTESQQKAFAEIVADMARPIPMNRLLHGDVGSGKTAVAVAAMLNAVASGHQAVLMAPTEILARQHERTLSGWLKASRVRIALWTGSTSHRQQLAEKIAAGDVDIVVGTQAIVQGDLKFKSLGLAVVDEQHKFGVRQRALIKSLSVNDPHYLVMTATPIPRTISMTVFGDLDVSTLIRPEHLKPTVHTYLGTAENREKWWAFVTKKLREGRQAFVVAPRVDAEDDLEISSAERLFESLANGPLEAFRLDVLHGRQTAEEKDAALQGFALGKTQVIIATSVVEVGIDVPNATVMTIESAERFGLSQLHQLRGRVGRGVHAGFVCAFSTSDNPVDNERLQAFADVQDGFELAEIDLRLRGPGDLFSAEQTGFPPLRIADLVQDVELLQRSREIAANMIAQDPELALPEHARLLQLMTRRYGATLELSNVG
ncbi:MAG: ATP-dependent DNA helicase RecG [Pirellulaceae bacterium]